MGIFVLVKTFHNPINRLWAYFTFAVAGWGWGAFTMGTLGPALLWWKFGYVSVIAIPVLFLHFIYRFLNKKNKIVVFIAYAIAVFFTITLLTGHLVTHLEFLFNSFYYNTNPSLLFSIFFVLWITAIIFSHYLLYNNMKAVTDIKRNQIKYFFLATAIGFSGGITCFLPVFGIRLYPYGNFLVILYPPIMTYAILKYHLMDINIVIRKGLIYSLIVTIITLIFLISVLLSEHFFHNMMRYHSVASSVLTASVIAIIFTPLKNRVQNLVDRTFFKATPMEIVDQNEKLKAVATLASGLAHEIKNPLTTLKAFSEHVPLKKDDPEFMQRYEKIVPQEIERINTLLQELLAFAKPSTPQRQSVNPNEIIQNLLALLEHKFKTSNVSVITRLNASTNIAADPNQLKQALLNLILNAIDAMPNGGMLTVSTETLSFPHASSGNLVLAKQLDARLIHSGMTKKDDTFTITISDTGCGIAPQDLKHIFDPFFTKKEKGTGLGLSITQGIIEKHGGKITVDSKLNQGTTFKITLPY